MKDLLAYYFLSTYDDAPFHVREKALTAYYFFVSLFVIDAVFLIYIKFFTSLLDWYYYMAGFFLLGTIIMCLFLLKKGSYYLSFNSINITYMVVMTAVLFHSIYVDPLLNYLAIAHIMAAQIAVVYFFCSWKSFITVSIVYLTDNIIFFVLTRPLVNNDMIQLFMTGFISSIISLLAIVLVSLFIKSSTDKVLSQSERELNKNLLNYQKIVKLNRELTMAHDEVIQSNIMLSAEKERLDITLRSIGEGVISIDTEGRISLFSRTAETITGWKQADAIDRNIQDILVLSDNRGSVYNPVPEILKEGKSFDEELFLMNREGDKRSISFKGAPIYDSDIGVLGGIFVISDISGRNKIFEELNKASRIESLGIFAGGIAHDFNNLLTAILGNISIARIGGDATDEVLCDAEKASLRAQELTHQLLTFSRGGEPVKKVTSIQELLVDTTHFVLSGSNIRCDFSISGDLWNVDVDAGQISQVIHNLVINSRQAMNDGGAIYISAGNVHQSEIKAPLKKNRKYIFISIRDEGIGIRQSDLNKIFDPYYSTKSNGTGLGLSIVYSIINKHSGHINADSSEGRGTEFKIYLPASEAPVEQGNRTVESACALCGRILVMDDDEMILKTLENMLSRLGLAVECARCGEETVSLYQKAIEQEIPFDAVIMDLTIPGKMGGREAVKVIRKIDPGAVVVVSSGYSNDPVMANYSQYGFDGVMVKPYRIEELREVLFQVMAGV